MKDKSRPTMAQEYRNAFRAADKLNSCLLSLAECTDLYADRMTADIVRVIARSMADRMTAERSFGKRTGIVATSHATKRVSDKKARKLARASMATNGRSTLED